MANEQIGKSLSAEAKKYLEEFEIAEKAGIVELLSEDEYQVHGVPPEVMESPDKEFGERYSVWKATKFNITQCCRF